MDWLRPRRTIRCAVIYCAAILFAVLAYYAYGPDSSHAYRPFASQTIWNAQVRKLHVSFAESPESGRLSFKITGEIGDLPELVSRLAFHPVSSRDNSGSSRESCCIIRGDAFECSGWISKSNSSVSYAIESESGETLSTGKIGVAVKPAAGDENRYARKAIAILALAAPIIAVAQLVCKIPKSRERGEPETMQDARDPVRDAEAAADDQEKESETENVLLVYGEESSGGHAGAGRLPPVRILRLSQHATGIPGCTLLALPCRAGREIDPRISVRQLRQPPSGQPRIYLSGGQRSRLQCPVRDGCLAAHQAKRSYRSILAPGRAAASHQKFFLRNGSIRPGCSS